MLWTRGQLGPWPKLSRVHCSSHHQTCFTLLGTYPFYSSQNSLEGRPVNTHRRPSVPTLKKDGAWPSGSPLSTWPLAF